MSDSEALYALGLIARTGCQTYNGGPRCSDDGSGRTKHGVFEAERWCDACIAQDALSHKLPRCEDESNGYFGGQCEAPARYRIERPGDGYAPTEACPAHVADMMAWIVDGDDVPLTVHVHFDESEIHDV